MKGARFLLSSNTGFEADVVAFVELAGHYLWNAVDMPDRPLVKVVVSLRTAPFTIRRSWCHNDMRFSYCRYSGRQPRWTLLVPW